MSSSVRRPITPGSSGPFRWLLRAMLAQGLDRQDAVLEIFSRETLP
jgi:hypothetical protein